MSEEIYTKEVPESWTIGEESDFHTQCKKDFLKKYPQFKMLGVKLITNRMELWG